MSAIIELILKNWPVIISTISSLIAGWHAHRIIMNDQKNAADIQDAVKTNSTMVINKDLMKDFTKK